MKICSQCKKEIEVSERVRRDETCPYCKNDLHSCMNCKFYDESKHNKCSEPNSEWVGDREKRNHCEYFLFKESCKIKNDKEEARKKLESLFISGKKN